MSTAFLIAARDVREKGRLFLIAAVLACMPFLATLLPSSRGHREDVIAMVGGFLGLILGLGLATAFGIGTFGRELSERRLSFWYSKPISPAALWAGRSLGALFSAIACFAIIAVPSMIVAGRTWHVHWLDEGWHLPVVVAAAMVVLFLVAHAMSTMVRSRSAMLIVDLVAAVAVMALLASVMRTVLFTPVFIPLLMGIGLGLCAVLAIAPYWQLANGRTDLRRSHAALSKAMWIGVAIVVALAEGVVLWLGSARPQSFDQVSTLSQTSTGNTVFVAGSAPYRRGMNATFAMNPATGESERIGIVPFGRVVPSPDGRFAAWIEPGLFTWSSGTIVVRDLERNENSSLNVDVGLYSPMVFSDDGSRLAVWSGTTVSVIDRASHRLLAALPLERSVGCLMWFRTPDVLRLISSRRVLATEESTMQIAELDLRTKRRSILGEGTVKGSGPVVSASADGSRMLLQYEGRIVDGRTGATIAQLPSRQGNARAAAMLHDGRVAMVQSTTAPSTLQIYSRDGVLQRETPLPTTKASIRGERTDGKLILVGYGEHTAPGVGRGRTMLLVDPTGGTVDRALENASGPGVPWDLDPRLTLYDANAKLAAVDANGKLTFWN